MSVRAGILITGTEVLTGIIADRNGPWLAERLRELGVGLSHTIVVGRPARRRPLGPRLPGSTGVDVIITSGGLGPTADDLTTDVGGGLQRAADDPRRSARAADRRDPRAADRPLAQSRPRRPA
jgi:nicotinamide-nucleotide amidase